MNDPIVHLDNDTRLTEAEELAAQALEKIAAVRDEIPVGARGPHGAMVGQAFSALLSNLNDSVRLAHWLRESA